MKDLEKMLLEAAGRTTTPDRNHHSSPPSRRRRSHSYSDNGSDSKSPESDTNRHYSTRKPSSSQVPLKKRLDPTHREDDHSSPEGRSYNHNHNQDHESDNDSIGSDLYKNENDRENLSKLTEFEREMILETRATKKSDRDLTEKLKRKGPDRKNQSPPKANTRNMRSRTERSGALDELKRRRDAARGGSGTKTEHYSPVKRHSFTLSSPSRSESGSHSGDSDDDKTSESKIPTFEEVKEITIHRSKLAKWFMEPFFDELIVGCFVRVGIGKSRSGPIYRLCVVRNVDATDPDRKYKLDNKTTHKYLNVVWGNESSAARWQMAVISDSPPKKAEFDQWVREVERSGGHMLTRQEVAEKRDAIKKANCFVYSAATVKQMVQEKKSATWKPLNVAVEKEKLRRALEVARENENGAEIRRIEGKLEELESSREAQKDSKAIRLAEMNRKNRVENFKNASEMKPVNKGMGEAGYDPFSRRWTRSRNYYAATGGDSGDLGVREEEGGGGGEGKLVDTSAPVDGSAEAYSGHDFEVRISLEGFGGAKGVKEGFMARKMRIEGMYGVRVKEDDGRRHALTLTVSDYKRRRGLL